MKDNNKEGIYINEVIRITYKCNWHCKFCNVLKTNNFWEKDINKKEVIFKILKLTRKYNKEQIKKIIVSFSWGEPTLSPQLIDYIKLAKLIWIWCIQIQTNGVVLFKNHDFIHTLIDAWLDEIFLAQHSSNDNINKELWSFFQKNDFNEWVKFIYENNIYKKVKISLNIVITKINLYSLIKHINTLRDIWFLDLVEWGDYKKIISFWFCQPNGYAEINKEKVLLRFDGEEEKELQRLVENCRENNIFPDFHFTAPPLCIFNYPQYNLEYIRLKSLKSDISEWIENKENLETYKVLWKEKEKLEACKKCLYNNYCLWFYKNWISFVGKEYVNKKINFFISLNSN